MTPAAAPPQGVTGSARAVTIGSVTKQHSNGRITFPLSMILTGELLGDLPDWVSECFDAVTGIAKKMTPEIQEVSDVMLCFENDKPKGNLFKMPNAKAPSSALKGFIILRVGDPEDPEIELHFTAYCPFSGELWTWLGQMAGAKVWMNFPTNLLQRAVAPDPGAQLPLESAGDSATAGRPAAAGSSGGPKPVPDAAKPASKPN